MQALNPGLGDRLARHLVTHGTQKGEDGRLRFKFDPAALPLMPIDLTYDQKCLLLARIICPLLLVYGGQSWARNPADDGRIEAFSNAHLALFEDAGHWVHHDRPDAFVAAVAAFLEPENRN
jgi:pimeloyl-ACP methyl ester carboxylesterase